MQDSMQLQSSQDQVYDHNQFPLSQVISPKGRRLTNGYNMNTASHESLAYSNSTYNKNQFTERSPPFFTLENINNQNINTLNFRPFDKKQSTFGSNKGLAIQFGKIKEQSYLSNFDDEKSHANALSIKQKLELPCFLSNQNSPNGVFQRHNDSLQPQSEQQGERVQQREGLNRRQQVISRKQLLEKANKAKKCKPGLKSSSSKKSILQKKYQKQNYIMIQNNESRSRSPFKNKARSPFQSRGSDQIQFLRHKIKQLQYALQVQSISTQELRTKVSVLNQLLEEKFLQKNGINFRLFKNSSPSAIRLRNTQKDSNIDLYVEMKVIQKAKQELEIQYERVKNQLSSKNQDLNNFATKCKQLTKKLVHSQKGKQQFKTQTSFLCGQTDKGQAISTIFADQHYSNKHFSQINDFEQERQTLLGYIEDQKKHMRDKDQKITNLQERINQQLIKIKSSQNYDQLLDQKQKRFSEIERPKFICQLKVLTDRLDSQKQQLLRLQMQNNLRQLKMSQGLFSASRPQCQQGRQIGQSPQKETSVFQADNRSPASKHVSPTSERVCPTSTHVSPTSAYISSKSSQYSPGKSIKNTKGSVPDAISLIIMQQQELKILKNQRDYFRTQCQQLKTLQNQIYTLRLRNQDLQNQLSSLHQLIEVQDQITF